MLHPADRVRDLAYNLWEQQGRPAGRELDHWLEAERRLGGEQRAPVSDIVAKAPGAAKKARNSKRK